MTRTVHATVAEPFGLPLALRACLESAPNLADVSISASARGVCHTNPRAAQGACPVTPALPFIPGPEAVGHVAVLGPGMNPIEVRKWAVTRAHSAAQ